MMFLLILLQIRLDFHFQTDRNFNKGFFEFCLDFFQKWRLLISRLLDFFQDSRIGVKEIQKLAYDALQNQVQERITVDEKRIENELIARRDIMKIKFNLKIESMMFSMAIQSGQFLKII